MLTARPCPERIRHFVLSGLRPVDRSSPNWYASFTNSLRALVVFLRDLTHDAEPEREPRPAVVADEPGPAAVLALQGGAGNAAVARMLTTASARMQVMRMTAAEQAWNAAVQDKDWAAAVGILDDLTNEEVKRLVGALADEDQSALGNAVLTLPRKDRERMRSRLEFLLEGVVPDAETTTGLRNFTITDPGAREHHGVAGPGQVEMRSGAAVAGGGKSAKGWFSLAYTSGAVSEDTRWLQFVWRDLEVEYEGGEHEFARAPYVAPSGTWRFSDPQAPQPHVDSLSGSSPFFEARGLNVRNPDMAAILDAPARPDQALSNFEDQESAGKNRTITRMVTRAHFVSYVIQGNAVAYRVAFTIEWPWRPETLGPSVRNVTGGAATALDAPHRSVLERDYPWAATAIGAPAEPELVH